MPMRQLATWSLLGVVLSSSLAWAQQSPSPIPLFTSGQVLTANALNQLVMPLNNLLDQLANGSLQGPAGPPGPNDVPGNLTLMDSLSADVGNVYKNGTLFLHNFGDRNTFLGAEAGNLTMSGNRNTAMGAFALFNNTTGSQNTALGLAALDSNTDGNRNTAVGHAALFSNATGSQNTAIGVATLDSNTKGNRNTAVGDAALFGNTSGFQNTAIGVAALDSNTDGNRNTAMGDSTLFSNTTGSDNTAMGAAALNLNMIGNNNTAMGRRALLNTTGSNNIAVGFEAGVNLSIGEGNIYLGNPGVDGESNIIRIGIQGQHTDTVLAGNVTSDGIFGLSDARLKTDITPLTQVRARLARVRAVAFAWNDVAAHMSGHTAGQRGVGVIAQEVEAVFPELVVTGPDGYKAVAYDKLSAMLVGAFNELDAMVQAQEARLTALEQAQGRSASLTPMQIWAAGWPMWGAVGSLLAALWWRRVS